MQATPILSNGNADATATETPRVEAQLDLSFDVQDLGGYWWVDGQYQNLDRTQAQSAAFKGLNQGNNNSCWLLLLVDGSDSEDV